MAQSNGQKSYHRKEKNKNNTRTSQSFDVYLDLTFNLIS